MIKIRIRLKGGTEIIRNTRMSIAEARKYYLKKLFFGGTVSAWYVEVV